MTVALDYADIKRMAREGGGRVDDLLALARQNDPFYVGTPADLAQAQWFADLWEAAGFTDGGHLRRLHYRCVSQEGLMQPNGKPYENTEGCWGYLCQASKAARYLGLVDFAEVVDHKNPDPHLHLWPQAEGNARFEVVVPELADPSFFTNWRLEAGDWQHGFNPATVQPYHLEVWCEKSTMNDALLPMCGRYHANFVTGEGEMSITAAWDLMGRLRESGKPARIFYISDFDPAGQSIPRAVARKVEWMASHTGLETEVKLCALVLTPEQVAEYGLPRTPNKKGENAKSESAKRAVQARAEAFEEKHGEGAVELDALEALHPGELGRIVREALGAYWSEEADAAMRESDRALQRAIRAEVDAVTGRYQEEIAALDAMREELANLEVPGLEAYEPETADPDEVTGDGAGYPWLYDSGREYLEQIAAYKGNGGGM